MKATGVVRRIDELGRIVIPKEIRKTMRLREGEKIEIYISNKDEILLKKFSTLKNISDFAQNFADSITSFIKHNIIITDTDSIIALSGPLKKEYLHKNISDELAFSIRRRENILQNYRKSIKLTDDKEIEGSYVINSIVVGGDVVGLIIILSEEETVKDTDEKIAQIASQFFTKYLEE